MAKKKSTKCNVEKEKLFVATYKNVIISVAATNMDSAYEKLEKALKEQNLYDDEGLKRELDMPEGLEETIEWIDLNEEEDGVFIWFNED